MSYEKQTWKNGDVIDENKLNYMEEGINSAGGFSIEPVEKIIVDASISTPSPIPNSNGYDGFTSIKVSFSNDSIKVIYDGEEYICSKVTSPQNPSYWVYGADPIPGENYSINYDFSKYPFYIGYASDTRYIKSVVEDGNSHTMKIIVTDEDVVPTSDFSKAVANSKILVYITRDESTETYKANKTYADIKEALENNIIPVLLYNDAVYHYRGLEPGGTDSMGYLFTTFDFYIDEDEGCNDVYLKWFSIRPSGFVKNGSYKLSHA